MDVLVNRRVAFNWIISSGLCTFVVYLFAVINNYNDSFKSILAVLLASFIFFVFQNKVADNTIRRNAIISVVFFLRLVVVLFVFQMGWANSLSEANSVAYYDPGRYYYQAIDLANTGFHLEQGIINYAGIIYWFAILFKVFGHNPLVAVIFNNLFSMISGVLIYRLLQYCNNEKISNMGMYRIIIGFCFIPELLWYDALTSRESLCMSLIVIIVYILFRYLYGRKSHRAHLVLLLSALILLGVVRLSFFIPVLAVFFIFLYFSFKNRIRRGRSIIIMLLLLGSLILMPFLGSRINSTSIDLLSILNRTASNNIYSDSGLTWSENSIGKLLIADSLLELIIISPIRMLVYLVTPLPNIAVNFKGLITHNYSAWQGMFALLSSIVYFLMLPNIFAGLQQGLKNDRDKRAIKLMALIFLVILFSVASGTQIIHERYRITAVPWIFAIILIGKHSDTKERNFGKFLFVVICVIALAAYAIIKFL